jgi:protein-tyrosine phosphatase
MAEALVRNKAPEAEVCSAGIFASDNSKANRHAREVLGEQDIMLDHRSQPVTGKLLNWADLVLTMTTEHKQSLILQHPNFQDKYFTFKEYVSESDKQIWNELKQAYAEFEEKRTRFIHRNERKMDNKQLDEMLRKHLQEDADRIRGLESGLINYDISDPFGGDLEIYRQTFVELQHYTDLLIEKISK